MAPSGQPARVRVRDPDRKQRILAAAAALGARRGFHAISMADIGAEAGIVGSGIYRHFGSKTSVRSGVPKDRLAARREEMAHGCLGTEPVTGPARGAGGRKP